MELRWLPSLVLQGSEHVYASKRDIYLYAKEHGWLEQENEMMFEFISTYHELNIVECGAHVFTVEKEIRRLGFDQANKATQSLLSTLILLKE